jgi:hypothetical protein
MPKNDNNRQTRASAGKENIGMEINWCNKMS